MNIIEKAFPYLVKVLFVWASLLGIACQPTTMPAPMPTRVATVVADLSTVSTIDLEAITLPATYTPSAPWTGPTATPTRMIFPTVTVLPTPDPYTGQTIADLASRSYGDGALEAVETMAAPNTFSRILIRYPSDGLSIYGFMNIPSGSGPFPVALILHGYIPPHEYHTIGYTAPYADALAEAGYLTIHPNYRNYPPSDDGENPFRIGYAIDVLNLIALIQAQAGQPGPLQQADPQSLFVLGHSMGGGIALRVITVSSVVDAAVLYGAMSGDEKRNYERIIQWSGGADGETELATLDVDLKRISPIYHLQRIQTAVSIHHGDADTVVPPEWSTELCERLRDLRKRVECFFYPGQPHNFTRSGNEQFLERVLAFFESHG